ncbi:hypothetical protein BKA62DRAFT_748456 [Auriculariales sp. MPI-PUGE-AT-0066]|nr:hypothetical protein BKA62DRAFT_748456 [Auriculariales sp. MPI-PUGE-AT-0066]
MSVRMPNGHGKPGISLPSPLYNRANRESWTTSVYFALPATRGRRLHIVLPIPPRVYQATVTRFGRRRGNILLAVCAFVVCWLYFSTSQHRRTHQPPGASTTTTKHSTLVFSRSDIRRIWEWEIASGHYPSTRPIPEQVGLVQYPLNPGLPPASNAHPQRQKNRPGVQNTVGTGSQRVYLDVVSKTPNTAYPPRPVANSIADLDIVMDHCDFSLNKYVRDCLEVLRIGSGLDNEKRTRRGNSNSWKYIYREEPSGYASTPPSIDQLEPMDEQRADADPNLWIHRDPMEPRLALKDPRPARPYYTLDASCDVDYPRIFHIFWAGPFTDKPYAALLSFLYTQNLGLHLDTPATTHCRPVFWVWINPGPAASVPNPHAYDDLMEMLESNPWSQPFLHPRFKDVIDFKLWNTTEQLDNIPEIRNDWRKFESSLFNSGGLIFKQPRKPAEENAEADKRIAAPDGKFDAKIKKIAAAVEEEEMFNRTGTTSPDSYDRISVVLSDMARFVLCHRFGGVYLDADTLLLRDWEELWGWRGAFAYRWSRLPRYNTAILRMNRGSALGSFLFRTALRNGLDFHPETVTRYIKEAMLEGILLRVPDALFDPAWLNIEQFQMDRPTFPFFPAWQDFFETPPLTAAAAMQAGFDGFFRGAYAYHWHNFWWLKFDPARNWPDLGSRFLHGEKKQRALLQEAKRKAEEKLIAARRAQRAAGLKPSLIAVAPPDPLLHMADAEVVPSDVRDLSWATVIKRTLEAYIREEQPNMYGEWLKW